MQARKVSNEITSTEYVYEGKGVEEKGNRWDGKSGCGSEIRRGGKESGRWIGN